MQTDLTGTQLLHNRIKILDGLRGLAILLVMGYHYFSFFSAGWIGVDLFFVSIGVSDYRKTGGGCRKTPLFFYFLLEAPAENSTPVLWYFNIFFYCCTPAVAFLYHCILPAADTSPGILLDFFHQLL